METYPTSQSASLGMQRPSDMTGWTGGKHALSAADAVCVYNTNRQHQ